MNRACVRPERSVDDRVNVEVAFACWSWPDAHCRVGAPDMQRLGVRIRIHGNGSDAQSPCGPDDAAGDLAAIGDENRIEHRNLHAKHAVGAFARIGRVSRYRQGKSEYAARIDRVDDAVIPEPRRRVIGMTLLLVLFADFLPEGALFRFRPGLAARLLTIPANNREDGGRL